MAQILLEKGRLLKDYENQKYLDTPTAERERLNKDEVYKESRKYFEQAQKTVLSLLKNYPKYLEKKGVMFRLPIIDWSEYEVKNKLSQVMDHVASRISELRSQESPADTMAPSIPQLEPGPFESSNVNSFKYDYPNEKLFVKFHGTDSAESGPIYSYEGVPKFIFDTFRKGAIGPKTSGKNKYHTWVKGVTPSLGAAMNSLIKNGGYPYQKVG
jgi:hypothetical protein